MDIETLGFKVIASSSWSDGTVKFEAHRVVGKRILVKGERSGYDAAYKSLYNECLRRIK